MPTWCVYNYFRPVVWFCVILRYLCSPHQGMHSKINATYSLIVPIFSGVYHDYTTIMFYLWLWRGVSDRCQHFVCMWQKLFMYVGGFLSRVVCFGIVSILCPVCIIQGFAFCLPEVTVQKCRTTATSSPFPYCWRKVVSSNVTLGIFGDV